MNPLVKRIACTGVVYIIASMFASTYDPIKWGLLVNIIVAIAVWDIWNSDD